MGGGVELEDPALTCLLVCQSPGPRPQVKGFGNYDRTFHGDLSYGLRNMEEGELFTEGTGMSIWSQNKQN